MSIRSLKESDLVTTTGFKLKQTFSNFNNHVSILRNMFDWKQPQWQHKRDWPAKKDKLVIGWVGLTSHFEDIKKMKPIMKYIHDKYSYTEFVLAGMALKDQLISISADKDGNKTMKEEEVTDEKLTYRFRVKELFSDFSPDRITVLDAVELEQYGKFYSMIDISLCFIEKNTFNQCKSEIKAVESMAYKCITMATNFGGYNDMYKLMPDNIKHKFNFIDSENTQSWIEALEYWVNNYDEGMKYAQMQHDWVKHFYDINENIHLRVDFYNRIIEENCDKEVNRIARIMV